jgi:hypothetical protein
LGNRARRRKFDRRLNGLPRLKFLRPSAALAKVAIGPAIYQIGTAEIVFTDEVRTWRRSFPAMFAVARWPGSMAGAK